MTTDHDIEDRVRTALQYLADETPVEANLEALTEDGRTSRVGRSRAWSRRSRTVGVLAATLIVSTGVMAIGSGGYVGEDSPGAVHRPMSELAQVVRTHADEIPFAPHRSLEDAITAWEDGFDADSTMATDAMVSMAADAAVCSWMDQWRNATMDGDHAAAAQAEQVIHEARGWPWWSLVNQQSAVDSVNSHLAAMRNDDLNYVTYQLGLNCLLAMTDAPHIRPKADQPLPDGVSVPDNFYRGE